jgi:hypothetical protein
MRYIIVLVSFISFAWMASADLVLYDGFNYDATGNPVLGIAATGAKAKGVWTSQGNGTIETRVTAGNLTFPGLPGSEGNRALLDNTTGTTSQGADASRLYIGGTNTSGTYYYSFITNVPSYTSNPAGFTEAYFAGFDNISNGTGYTTAGGLFVKKDATFSDQVDLGIATSGSAGKTYSSLSYPGGQSLFIVVSFTFGGPSTLDVFTSSDTIPGTAPVTHSAVTSTTDSTLSSITNIFLRGNPGESAGIQVDELRVATTWADAIPEPRLVGLFMLTAAGFVATRRRRRICLK